jgi:hypothetical protein
MNRAKEQWRGIDWEEDEKTGNERGESEGWIDSGG